MCFRRLSDFPDLFRQSVTLQTSSDSLLLCRPLQTVCYFADPAWDCVAVPTLSDTPLLYNALHEGMLLRLILNWPILAIDILIW
jgi:hypothetical protein